MSAAVRITVESTDELSLFPPPARVWRGRTDDGAEVVAYIAIGASPTGDQQSDERLREALETRIPSTAVITIPVGR